MRKPGRLDPEELKNARSTAPPSGGPGASPASTAPRSPISGDRPGRLRGTLPPLVFKALIDNALPPDHSDPGLVNRLFVAAVALAVVITALNLVNRWLGSRSAKA